MGRGKLLVLSGASGVGKSTAITGMRKKYPNMFFSVSATTRNMRDGDVDGVTYYFKSREEFLRMIDAGEFYEYAQYADNFYGTPKAPVEERLSRGEDVIMDIEVQGALQIKERCPDAVLIFLVAKDFSVVESRLRGRGDTSEEDIKKRLQQAKWEYTQAHNYHYIVLSDTPERTVNDIDCILQAEKLKAERNLDLTKLEESL